MSAHGTKRQLHDALRQAATAPIAASGRTQTDSNETVSGKSTRFTFALTPLIPITLRFVRACIMHTDG
jgi:hypothetical protein